MGLPSREEVGHSHFCLSFEITFSLLSSRSTTFHLTRIMATAGWLRSSGIAADLISCQSRGISSRRTFNLSKQAPPRAIRRWMSHHSRPVLSTTKASTTTFPTSNSRHISKLRLATQIPCRAFHTSPPRKDILFVSVPAFKAFLLSITRVTLVVLPFWWR